MKRLFFVCIILLFSLTTNAQPIWSLDDCIRYASEHNISIQKSLTSIQEQNIILSNMKNERLPSISLNSSESFFFGLSPSRDGTYKDNNQFSANLGFSMNMALFNAFRIKKNITIQNLNTKALSYSHILIQTNLTLNITATFLRILNLEEEMELSYKNLQKYEQILARFEILYSVGRKTKNDLIEIKYLLAKAKYNIVVKENEIKAAKHTLYNLMNYQGEFEVQKISDDLFISQCLTWSLEEIKTYVLDNDPSIKNAIIQHEIAKKNLSLIKTSFFPSITFNAGYNNNYYHSFTRNLNNKKFGTQIKNNGQEYVSLSFSMPIFNRFNLRNQKKQVELQIQNAQLNIIENQNTVIFAVTKAYMDISAIMQKYLAAKDNVYWANKVMENEMKMLEIGRSTLYNYSEMEKNLFTAQSEMLQTKYEYILKIIEIKMYMEDSDIDQNISHLY